eukprot:191085_1
MTSLALGIVASNAIGAVLGANFSPGKSNPNTKTWYKNLNKSPLNPPNWIFAPVWTFLYTSMNVAAYVVANDGGIFAKYSVGKMKQTPSKNTRDLLKYAFGAQLILNFIWTPLFFGLKKPGLALMEIIILLTSVVYLHNNYRKYNSFAANLMVPYIL